MHTHTLGYVFAAIDDQMGRMSPIYSAQVLENMVNGRDTRHGLYTCR